MAEVKRHMIELVKEVKEGEVVTEKYITPIHVSLDVHYEALDLLEGFQDMGEDIKKERKWKEQAIIFVSDVLYNGQFTKEELRKGLYGPTVDEELTAQVMFAARGFQSDASKKYLAKKS